MRVYMLFILKDADADPAEFAPYSAAQPASRALSPAPRTQRPVAEARHGEPASAALTLKGSAHWDPATRRAKRSAPPVPRNPFRTAVSVGADRQLRKTRWATPLERARLKNNPAAPTALPKPRRSISLDRLWNQHD